MQKYHVSNNKSQNAHSSSMLLSAALTCRSDIMAYPLHENPGKVDSSNPNLTGKSFLESPFDTGPGTLRSDEDTSPLIAEPSSISALMCNRDGEKWSGAGLK